VYGEVMLMHHQRSLDVVKDDKVRSMVALIQLANAVVSQVSFDSYLGAEVKEMLDAAEEELLIGHDVIDEVRIALMSNSLV